MTNPSSITAWLDHLQALLPPSAITLVGAGKGTGAWVQWLLREVKGARVTLIEAEPLQFATLQRTLNALGESAQHCEIRNTLVAAQQGTTPFFVASSQQESGLLQPQWLLNLWPNLQTKEVRDLNAITLDTLLGNLGGDVEQSMGQGHWLILDCLPAGELLRTSSKLDQVDVVIARVLLDEPHSVPAGASQKEVSELLQQNGMVQVAVDVTRHPSIGYALFVRDARAALHAQVQKHHSECQKLRLSSEEQAKLAHERQLQIEQLSQAKVAGEKQLQERVQQLVKERDSHAKSATECRAQIEQLTQAKAVAEKQALQKYEAQEKQFKEFQLQNSLEERINQVLVNQIDVGVKAQLDAFSKILQSSDSVTTEALQGIVNASEVKIKRELIKGLANSVKQLESFINIQSFLNKGEFFPEFHGWPISPDIGSFLIENMRFKNYDLIIEFGSGTSTELFAKAIEVIGETRGESKTEIVTFEHNKDFLIKTNNILHSRGLDKYVNLIHAPLIDYKCCDQNYLYYKCESILEDLAKKYNSQRIKILVFIDGPPGSTCKNARYPAVPLILKFFSEQSIDFVLDDSYRSEEANVIKLWGDFLEKKKLKFLKKEFSSEKGILYMSNF